MNSSHVATGAITALLATVLVYISHLSLQPHDLPTASAFAGLLVAVACGGVKFYKSGAAPVMAPVPSAVSITPASDVHKPSIAA